MLIQILRGAKWQLCPVGKRWQTSFCLLQLQNQGKWSAVPYLLLLLLQQRRVSHFVNELVYAAVAVVIFISWVVNVGSGGFFFFLLTLSRSLLVGFSLFEWAVADYKMNVF